MRIALVVQTFPKISETFIVNKFVGLLNAGYDVYLTCNVISKADWDKFPALAETVSLQRVRITPQINPRWRAITFFLLQIVRCVVRKPRTSTRYFIRGYKRFGASILRRFYLDSQLILLQPDIIHFEFGAQAVNRMHLKDLLGCKVTVSFRGYDINYVGLQNPNYYADIWNTADGLHFLGHDLYQRGIRRGCSDNQLVALIPPAIDVNYFVPNVNKPYSNDGKPKLRILSVGRLEWKKGYEFALQAIRQLSEIYDKPIEYRIIGEGSFFEALHFCRNQFALEDVVVFLGAVPVSRVIEEMRDADIFLHAAVSEGFCNAVLEAQAMQLPVVTSDADGLRENVENGLAGFVVPRRDPEALAEKLLDLAMDPILRWRMGEAGRQRVVQHFRLDQQIDAFVSFFNKVIES